MSASSAIQWRLIFGTFVVPLIVSLQLLGNTVVLVVQGLPCNSGSDCNGGNGVCRSNCCDIGGPNWQFFNEPYCTYCRNADGLCDACNTQLTPVNGVCPSPLSPGAACSTNVNCASNLCKGQSFGSEFCCTSGASSQCNACASSTGLCLGCTSNYYLRTSDSTCQLKQANGGPCTGNGECNSGSCKGGFCCGVNGQPAACTACASTTGVCATCNPTHFIQAGACVLITFSPTTSPSTSRPSVSPSKAPTTTRPSKSPSATPSRAPSSAVTNSPSSALTTSSHHGLCLVLSFLAIGMVVFK